MKKNKTQINRYRHRNRLCLLLLSLLLIISAVFSMPVNAADGGEDELSMLSEPGTRIGVEGGSVWDDLVQETFPDAQVEYYDKLQGYTAVAQGKLDAFVFDKLQMDLAVANGLSGVRVLDTTIGETIQVAFGIADHPSIPDLETQVNQFLVEIKADGTLDEVTTRWVVLNDYTMPDIGMPSDPQYHLTVGTTGVVEPYSFFEGDTLTGYDIELMYRLAAYLNADVEFQVYDWYSIMGAAQSGKVDMLATNLTVTPERAEAINFSDTLYEVENGIMVRDDGKSTWFDSVRRSFEKTFVREDRWKLFVQGIGTTLLITVLSALFGTVLGFLVFMACRRGNRIANAIARFFVWLITGMPVVVLLMILYYIIFAKSAISGTTVAVIAFTLVFGSGVFGMLQTGVGAVDKGQEEAALSLGYGDVKAFFRIILPQAEPVILPQYKGEIVALIEATAIVGYIAVHDLTKMGDIVRGRTYDAFFPLIAVALIYFILGALLTFLVGRIETGTDPKKRSREVILKGVRTDD